MRSFRKIAHRRNHFRLFITLGIMALLTAGCADVLRIQPLAARQNLSTQATLIPPIEETPLSILDVTGLPEHASTVTVGDISIETAISDAPLETPPPPTPEPTPCSNNPAATAPCIPDAEILILKPGDFSIMTSPFRVSAYLEPGHNYLVDLRLVGEDGSTLAKKSVMVLPWQGATKATMVSLIEFEIEPGMIEAARMEIGTRDEFGRPKAMNSIELILMSEGESMRNYAEILKERVVIQYPRNDTLIQGDTLLLSGLVKAPSEKPLSVELITETGEIVGASEAAVLLPEEGGYGIFATEVHYEVTEPTWVRLVISVPDARIPGMAYIKTRELLLYP
jgi:hypothetical protein